MNRERWADTWWVLSALECICGPTKRATVISTPFIPRLASLLASSRKKFFQSTLFVVYFLFSCSPPLSRFWCTFIPKASLLHTSVDLWGPDSSQLRKPGKKQWGKAFMVSFQLLETHLPPPCNYSIASDSQQLLSKSGQWWNAGAGGNQSSQTLSLVPSFLHQG